MSLYSYKGSEPTSLPNKITLSNGKSRTDSSSFSAEELKDAGFTGPYTVPSFDQEYQKLSWNSESLSYVVTDISDDVLWENIKKERNRLLSESDWTMAADTPGEINLIEWTKYRQRLRDLTESYSSPKEVVFPFKPDQVEEHELEEVTEGRLRWRVQDLEAKVKELEEKIDKLST